MSEPVVAGKKPLLVKFENAGEAIFWCACGRSAKQPLCDGSHKGTSYKPLRIVARQAGEEALLCACKRTKSPPYCDGSHNALGAYGAAGKDVAIDWDAAALSPRGRGNFGRFHLDGGCHVLTPDWAGAAEMGGLEILPTITPAEGADLLSQYLIRPKAAPMQPISFGGAEVVLFMVRGCTRIAIGTAEFEAPPNSAVSVRPGEAFQIKPTGGAPLEIVATVCPPEVAAHRRRRDF